MLVQAALVPTNGADVPGVEHVDVRLVVPQPLRRRRMIDERETLVRVKTGAVIAVRRGGGETHVWHVYSLRVVKPNKADDVSHHVGHIHLC